ncbi:hypothetical protein KP806_22625, partial [Paenibacillus sp. N4]|uniref:hypothetical protein n=1 Tax=Paenibacillus vietnamensis TaxID=2590547 RepID=UPI001CD173A6
HILLHFLQQNEPKAGLTSDLLHFLQQIYIADSRPYGRFPPCTAFTSALPATELRKSAPAQHSTALSAAE